ncbi:hypothetical protein AAE478_000968 [Parahypoxylon ruwenzoriense]
MPMTPIRRPDWTESKLAPLAGTTTVDVDGAEAVVGPTLVVEFETGYQVGEAEDVEMEVEVEVEVEEVVVFTATETLVATVGYAAGEETEDEVDAIELVEGVYSGQAVFVGLHLVMVTVAVR